MQKITAIYAKATKGNLPAFVFQPIEPAVKGDVTVTITGIPAGVTSASAWLTERSSTNQSQFGSAGVHTDSVQLNVQTNELRLIGRVDWNDPLECGMMLILG